MSNEKVEIHPGESSQPMEHNSETLTFKSNSTFLFDSDSSFPGLDSSNPTMIYDSDLSMQNLNFSDSFEFNSSYDNEKCESNQMNTTVQKCAIEFCQLKVNEATLNNIFKITENLIEYTRKMCYKSIEANKSNPLEATDATISAVSTELNKFNSTYKRNQQFKSDKNFIPAMEYGIGTHIDIKRDRKTKLLKQIHSQSTFFYASMIEKLRQLFATDDFRKEYFDFNTKTKHRCTPGIYKNFCCGEIYKNNTLFQEQPYAIQIQIFTDAFEICNPLKSKTILHSVNGVYFTIRNMPDRFAYNLNNIHLLAVIRDIDLKKKETDYSNIWEIVVEEIKELETYGILIHDGFVLKGMISKN